MSLIHTSILTYIVNAGYNKSTNNRSRIVRHVIMMRDTLFYTLKGDGPTQGIDGCIQAQSYMYLYGH